MLNWAFLSFLLGWLQWPLNCLPGGGSVPFFSLSFSKAIISAATRMTFLTDDPDVTSRLDLFREPLLLVGSSPDIQYLLSPSPRLSPAALTRVSTCQLSASVAHCLWCCFCLTCTSLLERCWEWLITWVIGASQVGQTCPATVPKPGMPLMCHTLTLQVWDHEAVLGQRWGDKVGANIRSLRVALCQLIKYFSILKSRMAASGVHHLSLPCSFCPVS